MAYRDYRAPGVGVIIQYQQTAEAANTIEFIPVFVGTGFTSRNRNLVFSNVSVDTSNFPYISVSVNLTGMMNSQMYVESRFTLSNLDIQKEIVPGTPITTLMDGVDYRITNGITVDSTGLASLTVLILNTSITNLDLVYDFAIMVENTDDDLDLRLVSTSDYYLFPDIFGPYILQENSSKLYNDLAIAAEIANRMRIPKFYYLEVPRDYGFQATDSDIADSLEKIYYKKNSYHIVPLTDSIDVAKSLQAFVDGIDNPIDSRERVGFVTYPVDKITSTKNMDELKSKIGQFSATLSSKRICNVFGAESVVLTLDQDYLLPAYFVNVAIACLDMVVGMVQPLSLRTINIFKKVNAPRFRETVWNQLAPYGVFIVMQGDDEGTLLIRHQLTTVQDNRVEEMEYSIVKNLDAISRTMKIRLAPYAGEYNITDGYMEKLDGTTTTSIEECKQLGYAKDIIVAVPWTLRTVQNSNGSTSTDPRNLVSRMQVIPVYPANNLDMYLMI